MRTRYIYEQEIDMPYTATRLRQNLYAILDSVLESGQSVEIERNGHILRIVPEERFSIWDRLEPHRIVNGDPPTSHYSYWNAMIFEFLPPLPLSLSARLTV